MNDNEKKPDYPPTFRTTSSDSDLCILVAALGDCLMWYPQTIKGIDPKRNPEKLLAFIEANLKDMRVAYEQSMGMMELVEHPELLEKHGLAGMANSLPNRQDLMKRTQAHMIGLFSLIIAMEVDNPIVLLESLFRVAPQIKDALSRIQDRDGKVFPGQYMCEVRTSNDQTDVPPEEKQVEVRIIAIDGANNTRRSATQQGDKLWQALNELRVKNGLPPQSIETPKSNE